MDLETDHALVSSLNTNLYGNYQGTRRKARTNASQYRQGPIPIEETGDRGIQNAGFNQLDSDLEDNNESEKRLGKEDSVAGSKGLLIYFARLGSSKDKEVVDFRFVETLISAGANVNFTDRLGQGVLHTIARDWHPDVAKFLIERGANVNLADSYGRTPLHVAASRDYNKMVEFLVERGARIEAKTKGEEQTTVHYAAKKNALAALKSLLKLGGNINARDYKMRTPLFVAAELGRKETVKYLLEFGAPAGVYDSGGNSAVAVMVEKMPDNAKLALDQFIIVDGALRKSYFYLTYMELDKKRLKIIEKPLAKTPLELIVLYKELDLISNPVVQKLMNVKWRLFGFKYTMLTLMINLFYSLIWTALGFTLPRSGAFYDDLKGTIWKIVLESILVVMTIYFIVLQIITMRGTQHRFNRWRDWKIRELQRDLVHCHPRYPEERRFLMNEMQRLKDYRGEYFQSFWNIFEWICLISIVALIVTRGTYTYIFNTDKTNTSLSRLLNAHKIIFAVTLLFVWLRMMKVFQGFSFLAAFITLLGHVAADTVKFAFLFFEFFIPFVCAFWMIFGGSENAKIFAKAGEPDHYFATARETIMTVWIITMIGDFPYRGMVAVNEHLAEILVAFYWGLVSLVCVNLYIALMSETFSRVYANAQANADLQQASLMLGFEKGLNHKETKRLHRYFNKNCAPLEEFASDFGKSSTDADALYNMVELVYKEIDRLNTKMDGSNADMEDVHEHLEDTIGVIGDDMVTVKKMLTTLTEQQAEIVEYVRKSGFRGMVYQGGEAIDSIKARFSRLVSRRNSLEPAASLATTDTSLSDDTELDSNQTENRDHNSRSRRATRLRKRTLKRTSSVPTDLDQKP